MSSSRELAEYYDDFSLCSNTVKEIIRKYKAPILAGDFSEDERPIAMVWNVTGIIGNGGFHCLFESLLPGDPDYKFTLEAFKAVGCEEALKAIEDALCLFPDCKPPLDDKIRIDQFESCPEELVAAIDRKFFDTIDACTSQLADYIRKTRYFDFGENEPEGTEY